MGLIYKESRGRLSIGWIRVMLCIWLVEYTSGSVLNQGFGRMGNRNVSSRSNSRTCDPHGNPCKDGLLIPMWKPSLSDMQSQLNDIPDPVKLRNPLPLPMSAAAANPFGYYGPGVAQRRHELERSIRWATIVRGIVYFSALVYLFIGVSIIADRFMAAIEVITSKEKDVAVKRRRSTPIYNTTGVRGSTKPWELSNLLSPNSAAGATGQDKDRRIDVGGEEEVTIVTVRIWNETVSNLTLMALGSSAPEIMLSVIEVVGKNFEAGELGPGTIVGSAAFNLFVIVGLCIVVIPSPGIKKIRYLRVFFLTASWSIFAYIWLYLILAVISPGVVSVTEGIITFLYFPLTVLTAYVVDKQLYQRWSFIPKRYEAQYKHSASVVAPDLEEDGAFVSHGPPRRISILVDGKAVTLPVFEQRDKNTTSETVPTNPKSTSSQVKFALPTIVSNTNLDDMIGTGQPGDPMIPKQQYQPSIGSGTVISATGRQSDASAVNEYLEFERTRQLYMQALSEARRKNPEADLKTWESMASYQVLNQGPKSRAYYRIQATRKLLTKETTPLDKRHFKAMSGKLFHDSVKIKAMAAPITRGLSFKSKTDPLTTRVFFDPGNYTVMENSGTCTLRVVREGAHLERALMVDYETRDGTANAHEDYVPSNGSLTFGPGDTETTISIGIIDDDVFEEDEYFYVELKNLRFGRDKKHSVAELLGDDPNPNVLNNASSNKASWNDSQKLILDNPKVATVMIFDDDHGGTFQLEKESYRCNEDCGVLNIRVIRKTGARGKVYVPYHTQDGTALGQDIEEERERFFNRLNKRRSSANILDQPATDDSKGSKEKNSPAGAGRTSKGDSDGLFKKSALPTLRFEGGGGGAGADDELSNVVTTSDFDNLSERATNAKDYESCRGFLVFDNEQTEGFISIRIIDTEEYEKDESFMLYLGQPIWITKDPDDINDSLPRTPRPSLISKMDTTNMLGAPTLGNPSSCVITITESKDFKLTIDKLLKKTNMAFMVGTSSWKDQFLEAFSINPSSSGDDKEQAGPPSKPSIGDYCLHFLTLFWKVLFASVPPTDYWGGWCCFIFAIIWIGILTAVIGDLAAAFGCTIGLKDSVTAISFVALGTSVPDTFASKVAAQQDEYADASIGNVTGSNAVNVFLGIGLAWSAAAIYHAVKGTPFLVDPGSLAFSVTIYCVLALVVIAVLMIKRTMTKGELGGPFPCKMITGAILFGFWVVYLLLASLESYCIIKGF